MLPFICSSASLWLPVLSYKDWHCRRSWRMLSYSFFPLPSQPYFTTQLTWHTCYLSFKLLFSDCHRFLGQESSFGEMSVCTVEVARPEPVIQIPFRVSGKRHFLCATHLTLKQGMKWVRCITHLHSLRDPCRLPTGYPETMGIQQSLPQKYMFAFQACKITKMNPVFPIQPTNWTWFLLVFSLHRNISYIFIQDSNMDKIIYLRSKLSSCFSPHMTSMKIFVCLGINGEQNNRSEYCCAAQRTKFFSWNVIFTKGKVSVPCFPLPF